MYVQEVDRIHDVDFGGGLKWQDVFYELEVQFSKFYYDEADTVWLFEQFDRNEKEALRLLEKGLVFPAYDHVLKCSHSFNMLDARSAISVTERVKRYCAGPQYGAQMRPGLP